MTRRSFAPRPTSTPCRSTHPSTSARECTRTPGERIERRTSPPEMTQPDDTSDSIACPVWIVRPVWRLCRLIAKCVDAARVVGVDDAERRRSGAWNANAGDRDAGDGCDVLLDHLPRVHAIDVVGTEHDDIGRLFVVHEV